MRQPEVIRIYALLGGKIEPGYTPWGTRGEVIKQSQKLIKASNGAIKWVYLPLWECDEVEDGQA